MSKIIIGLDESGVGNVLGPIVVAGVAIEENYLKELKAMGIRDSKEVRNENKLFELYSKIYEIGYTKIEVISPKTFDAIKENPNMRLDEYLCNQFSSIINSYIDAYKNFNGGKRKRFCIYVDGCLKDIRKCKSLIYNGIRDKKYLDKLIVEHHADEKYSVVASASIIAKAKLCEIFHIYRRKYGEIGSGNGSDSVTRNFLEEYLKKHKQLPPIARKYCRYNNILSSQTYKILLETLYSN